MTEPLRLIVMASGGGSNLQAILDHIKSGQLIAQVVAVISDQKEAYALQRAKQAGIPVYFIDPDQALSKEDYERQLVDICNQYEPDYICLAGYMRLLTAAFIHAFSNKVLNIHPSLLPAFKGLAAQKQALDYGVKVTGCTVHFVDIGMDTGPIIAQKTVPVLPDDSIDTLTQRILKAEHQLYSEVLILLQQKKVNIKGRKVIIGGELVGETSVN